MVSLSDGGPADIVDAFGTVSGCFDDIMNIDNVYFDSMVNQVCPSGLWLGRAGTSDARATFLDVRLPISHDIVSAKIYDRRGDFHFEVVHFPFMYGCVPRSASCVVFVSQLVRFAGASSDVSDFSTRSGLLA